MNKNLKIKELETWKKIVTICKYFGVEMKYSGVVD